MYALQQQNMQMQQQNAEMQQQNDQLLRICSALARSSRVCLDPVDEEAMGHLELIPQETVQTI